ncbi:MAG: hypothetical protein ACI8UO_003825 [Verrucomicrobiales bacterium]|jgi:hypothetical protein
MAGSIFVAYDFAIGGTLPDSRGVAGCSGESAVHEFAHGVASDSREEHDGG